MARELGLSIPGRLEWIFAGALTLTTIGAFGKAEINREAIPTPAPTVTPYPTVEPWRYGGSWAYSGYPYNGYPPSYEDGEERRRFDLSPTATSTPRPTSTPQAVIPTATRLYCHETVVGGKRSCQ